MGRRAVLPPLWLEKACAVNVDVVAVTVGLLGFLLTMGTAWQGKFRTAAGFGILTGALLVACMFVFRPGADTAAASGSGTFAVVRQG
jgi:hypothetical protein